jgi:hypothetical protein
MASSATSHPPPKASSPSRKNSSARSSDSPKPTHAVLSIKPEYAEAIFSGKKRFEFRRAIFKHDIKVVVVYITSPVGQVAGEFKVDDIITDDVDAPFYVVDLAILAKGNLWACAEDFARLANNGTFNCFQSDQALIF